jgi:hypothetical protein
MDEIHVRVKSGANTRRGSKATMPKLRRTSRTRQIEYLNGVVEQDQECLEFEGMGLGKRHDIVGWLCCVGIDLVPWRGWQKFDVGMV